MYPLSFASLLLAENLRLHNSHLCPRSPRYLDPHLRLGRCWSVCCVPRHNCGVPPRRWSYHCPNHHHPCHLPGPPCHRRRVLRSPLRRLPHCCKPGAPPSRSGRSSRGLSGSSGSICRHFFPPRQISLGPGNKVPSGGGARRTHSAPPLAHTHSSRVLLVRPLAHVRVLGTPAVGSRPTKSLQCNHASVFCRDAAWAHARCPTPAAVSPCLQAPEGRASPALVQVGQGSRPCPCSAT